MSRRLKKILVIRFSSIGDIVLTSPIVRCIKEQTQAEVHFLTKRKFISLLEVNPYIDHIHTIEKSIKEVDKSLLAEGFDFVVDLHKNIRSKLLCWKLGVPNSSYSKLNLQKWLLINLNVDKLPRIHVVDRYFEAVKSINVYNDGEGMDFYISEKNRHSLASKTSSLSKPYIVISLGASYLTKRLSLSVLKKILNQQNHSFVLIGGKDCKELAQTLEKTYLSKVCNLVGVLNLQESAALIEKAKFVITGDTGMMHISAALNKKVMMIWGSTLPKFGFEPYYGSNHSNKHINLEVNGLSCRPCSKHGKHNCPKGHFKCMEDHSPTRLNQAFDRLIKS